MDIERQQEELLAATRAVEDVPAAPEPIVEEPRPAVVEHAVDTWTRACHRYRRRLTPTCASPVCLGSRAEPGSNSTCSGRSVTNGFRHIGTAKAKTSTTLEMGGGWSRRAFVIAIAAFLFMRGASKPPDSRSEPYLRERRFASPGKHVPGALHLRYPGWKARH